MGGTGHGRCQRGGHGFRGGNNRDISTPRPNVTGDYHEKMDNRTKEYRCRR